MNTSLKKYLEDGSKTQLDFAREVGVRPATVTAWMQGTTPRPPQIAKIAKVTKGAVPVTSWFSEAAA